MDLAAAPCCSAPAPPSCRPPAASTETVRRGKIDFFTSRPPWSDRGWGGCWSCHPDGRTDTVTWSFEAGPRQTISLDGTFNHTRSGGSARAQLEPGARREPGLRAQHARRLRRPRLHHRRHRPERRRPDAGLGSQRAQLRPRQLRPRLSSRRTSPPSSSSASAAPIAPPSSSGNPTRGRDIFGVRRPTAPTASPATAAASGRPAASPTIRRRQSRCRAPTPAIVDTRRSTALGVPQRLQLAAGAGRICEVPPPPGVDAGAASRIAPPGRHLHGREPDRGARQRDQPGQHRGAGADRRSPRSAATASTRRRCSASSTARPTSTTAPRRRSRRRSASAPIPTSSPRSQAHWRAGTGGQANILDSDATAVTDLIAFLRTIDERTPPFPAADLAPDDPVFADATALCDCQKDPPLGTPALDCTP